jgi:hypothetical protein
MRTPLALPALALATVAGTLTLAGPAHAADDRRPPTVAFSSDPPDQGVWHRKAALSVHFSVNDAGSGINAGDGVLYLSGATTGQVDISEGATVQLSNQGLTTLRWVVADVAGNENRGSTTIGLDDVGPTAAAPGVAAREVVLRGSDHALTASCADATSGVATCRIETGAVLATGTTGAQEVRVSAADHAGNTTVTTVPYVVVDSLDQTPFTTVLPRTEPNARGWYRAPVTLDARSTTPYAGGRVERLEWSVGVPGRAGSAETDRAELGVDTDGVTEVVARGIDSGDLVGGWASHTIRLDRRAPTATLEVGGPYAVGEVAKATHECDDATSGVWAHRVTGLLADRASLDTSRAGSSTVTLTCEDVAGNTTTVTRTYEVRAGTTPTQPVVTPTATKAASTLAATYRVRGRKVVATLRVAGATGGTVTLRDRGTVVGTATLDARGRATATLRLKKGRHQLSAAYAGSDVLLPSTSPRKKVRVR